jgi:hypothetical protein
VRDREITVLIVAIMFFPAAPKGSTCTLLNLNEEGARKEIKKGNNKSPTAQEHMQIKMILDAIHFGLIPIKNRQQPRRGRENEDDVVLKDKLFEGEYKRILQKKTQDPESIQITQSIIIIIVRAVLKTLITRRS